MTNNNLQKIIDIVHKLQEEMVANNVSGGQIAGTVEAGDSPPVRKKKPPILARGKLPGMRTRFKKGADFMINLKKNK
tara:strand:+ start:1123 stop:1353 length:231 start_codon:yes stop_codon:yes gene_type:complete